MLAAVTAQIVSDEGQIIDGSPTVDGSEVVFKLKGSSREMIGQDGADRSDCGDTEL